MCSVGLVRGEEFLIQAARTLFEDRYENRAMYVGQKLHQDLEWTPALRFVLSNHINVFVEPSETGPYPRILKLKQAEVRGFPQPIAVYAVCSEEMTTSPEQQSEMKRLQAHGFGLITVDRTGVGTRVFGAIPLVQVIPIAEFKNTIKGLPLRIRQGLSEAYDDYQNQPVNGVKSLSEIMEGLVEQAGNDAIKKSHISKRKLGKSLASVLDSLHDIPGFKSIRAEIGAVRGYVKEYRNMSHHWPNSKRKAYEKFSGCRQAFLEGIKQIRRFREAARRVGLSGNLPRL